MIRFRLTTPVGPVEVFLEVDSAEEEAVVQYHGSDAAIAAVRPDVENSYGARGRGICDATHAIDLHFAMRQQRLLPYRPRLVAGGELLPS